VVGVVLSTISLRKEGGVRERYKCLNMDFLLLIIDYLHSLWCTCMGYDKGVLFSRG
jgi:hypothetical protein